MQTEDPYTWTFDSKIINILFYTKESTSLDMQSNFLGKKSCNFVLFLQKITFTQNIITLIEKWLKVMEEVHHLLKQEAQNMLRKLIFLKIIHLISTLPIFGMVLGKIWMPEIEIDEIKALFYEELNQDIPLTYIALYNDIPVGSCTLELQGDSTRFGTMDWRFGLLIPNTKQGIGKTIKHYSSKSKELGFKQSYLLLLTMQ